MTKMTILGSPNVQHDPRNTNSKYIEQEWPKMGKYCHELPNLPKNDQFWVQNGPYDLKKFLPSFQDFEKLLFYDPTYNSYSNALNRYPDLKLARYQTNDLPPNLACLGGCLASLVRCLQVHTGHANCHLSTFVCQIKAFFYHLGFLVNFCFGVDPSHAEKIAPQIKIGMGKCISEAEIWHDQKTCF